MVRPDAEPGAGLALTPGPTGNALGKRYTDEAGVSSCCARKQGGGAVGNRGADGAQRGEAAPGFD